MTKTDHILEKIAKTNKSKNKKSKKKKSKKKKGFFSSMKSTFSHPFYGGLLGLNLGSGLGGLIGAGIGSKFKVKSPRFSERHGPNWDAIEKGLYAGGIVGGVAGAAGGVKVWPRLMGPKVENNEGVKTASKADHILEKIAKKRKRKKRKSKATWKNTAIVGGAGVVSTVMPFVPLHVGSAIERAPKGYKGKAAKDTYKWGHIASAPSTALLLSHALMRRGPASKVYTFLKSPKPKNWSNAWESMKRMKKPFKDYVIYGSLSQGAGAAYGYRKGLTPGTPGRKRKRKRRRKK